MSAVNFGRQPVIAGQKIGVSPLFAALLWFVVVGLTMMNIYHIDNFLVSKLTDSSTSFLFIWILHVISVSAALLEVPLAKSIVTNYRLHGFNSNVALQGVFTLIIASMAVIGGINSQLSDADKRDAQIESHNSILNSYESRKRNLEIARDNRKLQVKRMKDRDSRAIEINRADSDYYAALSRLQSGMADHQKQRPTRAVKTGSLLHWITISLFSLVCSFGVIFVSGFMAVYYQSLVSLPAFSLMSKANHAWSSSGADFVTSKHEISPLNNRMEGFAKVEKSAVSTPPPTPKTNDLTSAEKRAAENRPAPYDSTPGAVSNSERSTSERSLINGAKQGDKSEYADKHYIAIKSAIQRGEIKPTQAPIKKKLIQMNVRFVNDADRQRQAVNILDRLAMEGVIFSNPEYGKTGKTVAKYLVYKPSKSNEGSDSSDIDPEVVTADEVGPNDIETRCGHCGNYDYTLVSDLVEKQKGIVKCSGCDKGYVAASHVTKDSKSIEQAMIDLGATKSKAGTTIEGKS